MGNNTSEKISLYVVIQALILINVHTMSNIEIVRVKPV